MIKHTTPEILLLGGFMWNQGLKWMHNTRPEWFEHPDHVLICMTLQRMSRENKHIEMTSVAQECKEVKAGYIAEIYNAYSGQEVSYYWAIVRQDWTKRRGKQVFAELSNQFTDGDPFKVLKQAQNVIDEMQLTESGQSRNLQDLMKERVSSLDKRRKQEIKTVGHPTGFQGLDKYIGGFVAGEMIVVAGRPGMGKTAFAYCIGTKHCEQGGRVVMFSLEMSPEQIGDRGLAVLGQVDNMRIRRADISDHEFERIQSNVNNYAVDFEVDTTTGITIDQIRARVKCMRIKPTLLIIDYMQLVTTQNSKVREQQISYISRQCKLIAKDCGCTVMALSQLNREAEKRADNKPSLADLRESGAIEQDADTVLFPYRPQYYLKNASELPDLEEDCELIISKCRNGMTGKLKLYFRSQTVEYLW
jgi:replicative DNA helicase